MKVEDLYFKWFNIFIFNGIPLSFDKIVPDIISFNNENIYTNDTYKFCYYFENEFYNTYNLDDKDYKIFADMFFKDNWKDELEYVLITFPNKVNIKPNKKYSDNYGDISLNVKQWVDYVTFQGSRIIIQFRLNDYIRTELRKEKLIKLNDI